MEDPAAAVAEIARTLRPGGVLLAVEMTRHDREEYRHTMGHRHLGFSEKDVRAWAKEAPIGQARFRSLRPNTSGKGPGLFAATLRRDAAS